MNPLFGFEVNVAFVFMAFPGDLQPFGPVGPPRLPMLLTNPDVVGG